MVDRKHESDKYKEPRSTWVGVTKKDKDGKDSPFSLKGLEGTRLENAPEDDVTSACS